MSLLSVCTAYAQEGEVSVNPEGKKAILKQGQPVTEYLFDEVTKFGNGLYVVVRDGKRGLVSEEGKQVTMTIYDRVEPLKNGKILVVMAGKTGILNADGTTLTPPKYDVLVMGTNGFSQVQVQGKLGLLNAYGQEIVHPEYDEVRPLKNGMTEVKRNKKIGYVGSSAQELLPPIYDDVRFLTNGRVELRRGSFLGYATSDLSTILVPAEFEKVTFLADGKAMVQKGGKTGYYSKTGIQLVPPIYDQARFFPDGKVYVTLNRKNGILTSEGKEFVPARYDNIRFERTHIIRAEINASRTVEYYTSQGTQYQSIEKFRNTTAGTFALAQRQGKFGLLDTMGVERIVCEYDTLTSIDSLGCFRAVKQAKAFLVNLDGTIRTTDSFDEIDVFVAQRARVKQGTLYGYIDIMGNIVIPIRYTLAERFTEQGQAIVKEAEQSITIDIMGNPIQVAIPSEKQ